MLQFKNQTTECWLYVGHYAQLFIHLFSGPHSTVQTGYFFIIYRWRQWISETGLHAESHTAYSLLQMEMTAGLNFLTSKPLTFQPHGLSHPLKVFSIELYPLDLKSKVNLPEFVGFPNHFQDTSCWKIRTSENASHKLFFMYNLLFLKLILTFVSLLPYVCHRHELWLI